MITLLVLAILVLLIVVHEFGHFIVAKLFGIRVEEFGIGYPPRAFRLGKIGETEYTINWIFAGGFVKLFGDEGDAKVHGKGSFVDAPRYAQAAVLFAGVAMNAIMAWALFTGALMTGIPRAVDAPRAGEPVKLMVSDVMPGSPAAAAGLIAGDEIIAIQDTNSVHPNSLAPSVVTAYVGTHGGQRITITLIRANATTTTTAQPANGVIADSPGRVALGVGLVMVNSNPLKWWQAPIEAFASTYDAFVRTAQSLWTLLAGAFAGHPDIAGVVGPVGLVSIVGQAAQNGMGNVLALAAFISVNLAIINLIPIPILDGGRIVVLAIETVLRRESPRIIINILNMLGVVLIGLLMIVITYHDIARLLW